MSNLFDRPVSVTHAMSVAFWLIGLGLITAQLIHMWETADLGLFSTGVGVVLTIRGYLCHFHHRERNAFELGRDSVSNVREIR